MKKLPQARQLLKAVEQYGSPLYVYDMNVIEKQFTTLIKAFSSIPCRLKYACKALTNINIVSYLRGLGAGVDTVSIQEVHIALEAGYQPNDIIFTPNCVGFDEVAKAVKLGVVINIDAISLLEQFGLAYGDSVPVCIRLNPHIMAGGNYEISTGHIDSKFGISIHQMRHVERIIERTSLNVIGLHMHTGSDILDPDVFIQGANILFEYAHTFPDLQFIDLGSGFKVPYKTGDKHTDIKRLGKKVSKAFQDFCKAYGRELELWFEPGKYLVSEAGYLLTKVNVLKQTTATVFAGVDTGMNHLLRPKLYNAYHHISNISNPEGTKRFYTVVGNICETDTFARDREIPEIREGDLLAFHNAGAYGRMMSSNYNSRFRPAEAMLHDGKIHLIRKRETMEDLMKNQVRVISRSK